MRNLFLIVIVSATGIGCAVDQAPGTPADQMVLPGYADYMEHCASCHGPSGRGDGAVAEVLAIPISDITRLAWDKGGKFPEKYVRWAIDGRGDIIAHGSREMPVWGNEFRHEEGLGDLPALRAPDKSTKNRIEDLVDYVRSIQRFDEST